MSYFEHAFLVGKCDCGGDLVVYLASEPENAFNAYCLRCKSISDVRFKKKGDEYTWSVPDTLKTIKTERDARGLETPDPSVAEVSPIVTLDHPKVHL